MIATLFKTTAALFAGVDLFHNAHFSVSDSQLKFDKCNPALKPPVILNYIFDSSESSTERHADGHDYSSMRVVHILQRTNCRRRQRAE